MISIRLAPEARADLQAILRRSRAEFGPIVRGRYRALLEQAFADLASDPGRNGVAAREGLPADVRLYHLRHSRTRIPPTALRGRGISWRFACNPMRSPYCGCFTTAWTSRRT